MASTIKTKNSVTTTVTPTTLEQGELAVNIADKKLWVGNATSTPILLVSKDNADTPLVVNGSSSSGAEIRLGEDTDNGSNYVALKSPASVASNLTFTLPGTDGSTNQVLATNGSGTLSFMSVTNGEPVVQTYNSGTAATWTKPTSANFVKIEMWGGGGSGAKGSSSGLSGGGGGGGSYNSITVLFADLDGTVTYTVGAGGASQTGSNQSGNAGGATSVTLATYAGGSDVTLYAYGGGGGASDSQSSGGGGGGQGGGILGIGETASNTNGGDNQNGYGDFVYRGGLGAGANNGASTGSYYGGGGAGAGNTNKNAASSYFGGAGGGGSGSTIGSTDPGTGGSSIFGGAGGAGAKGSTSATAGTAPAGGGGGSEAGNSGAGAAGRITFTYW